MDAETYSRKMVSELKATEMLFWYVGFLKQK